MLMTEVLGCHAIVNRFRRVFSQHGQEKQLMYNGIDTMCVGEMWEACNLPDLKWLFSLCVTAFEMNLNIKPLIYLLVRKLIQNHKSLTRQCVCTLWWEDNI